MSGRTHVAARLFVGSGLVSTGVYALQLSNVVDSVVTIVVAVSACIALLVGPRLNRTSMRASWRLIAAAAILFLVGVVVRPFATAQNGPAEGLADAFTLTGYALLLGGLALMLRRRGSLVRHAVTDGVIVCLGLGLLSILLLALPAMRIESRPQWVSLAAGIYPLIDVLLLLLLLNLGFSSANRLTSFRLMAAAMTAMFVGDIGYAWIGTDGHLTGSPLLDLPFLLTYTFFGAAALHPSMTGFDSIEAKPVQSWSLPRLSLIVPALASPVLVLATRSLNEQARLVLAVVVAALLTALLVRAVSAVHSYAQVQEGLRYQATHDALTGLPNRVLLGERISDLLSGPTRPGTQPWLIFLDIDGFKLVNDHWGHDTGDLLLTEVADRLRRLVGPGRTVARIAGDEFVVTGVGGPADAEMLAQDIQKAFQTPAQLPGLELAVAASIGVAVRTDQNTAEGLLRDADLAMYRAKAEGRNRIMVFQLAMRQTVRDRVEIELALRQAITRGQLWVAYQPIVDTLSGRTVGAEALLRWAHPVRGSISPVDFIPVAEETGLIVEIGTWVLRESLHQLAEWRRQGLLPSDFRLSVNASARQISDESFHELVRAVLEEFGLGAGQLIIEITESVMMGSPETIVDRLLALRTMGVGLSVDDFGTGYSSLSYLSHFPVTGVKIDRSFVSGLGQDERAGAIVRAVVAMAKALGLSLVAEGIETHEQRTELCRLGVDHGQGWLWSPALPSPEFAQAYLASRATSRSDAQAGSGNS